MNNYADDLMECPLCEGTGDIGEDDEPYCPMCEGDCSVASEQTLPDGAPARELVK